MFSSISCVARKLRPPGLNRHEETPFLVPGVVAMELVVGSTDKIALRRVLKFLDTFEVAWPTATETRNAYELLVEHSLRTAIGIPDCLIAAMARQRGMALYSFNLRHFGQIEGLEVSTPYTR